MSNGMNRREFLAGLGAAAAVSAMGDGAWGQSRPARRGGVGGGAGRGAGARAFELPSELAEFAALSVVLGRTTTKSVAVNALSAAGGDAVLEWGAGAETKRFTQSRAVRLEAGVPSEVVVEGLRPGAEYGYRLRPAKSAGAKDVVREGVVRTSPGGSGADASKAEGFTFTIQGDSHPERPQMSDPALYARTLLSVAEDRPAFHVCMGDDFSIDNLRSYTAETVASRYALQRPFLGLVGKGSPVFLVNGNHEQASRYNYDQGGEARNAAVWAATARGRYFSLPGGDDSAGFYTGNNEPLEGVGGGLRDYYAWHWGDALFVVLDNYWHSPAMVDQGLGEERKAIDEGRAGPGMPPPGSNGVGGGRGKERDWWGITLGERQYRFLERALSTSRARFKFVFAHHVLGTGRGGVERAGLYEWGGRNQRGGDEFAARRAGWALPIHQLMVKHGVSAFFQGHDHIYASQTLDGVVYQTVPVPGDPNYALLNGERYTQGTKLPNSGYVRVKVGAGEAKVEYVRSYLAKDENATRKHGEVAHSYAIKAKG